MSTSKDAYHIMRTENMLPFMTINLNVSLLNFTNCILFKTDDTC